MDSVFAGFTIGAPPIINYGSLQMKHEILPGVLAGIYCSLSSYQDFQSGVPEVLPQRSSDASANSSDALTFFSWALSSLYFEQTDRLGRLMY